MLKHKSSKISKIKIGTDICQIDHIKSVYKRHRTRFLNRILTKNEIKYVTSEKRNFIARLAGRFAAKEATSKVLGIGLKDLYFKEVEILREKSGSPKIVLHKRAKKRAKKLGLINFAVSISHERDFAIAFAIGVGN